VWTFRTASQANRAPVAANDAYAASEDHPLTVPAPGVLGNDSDADGNSLTSLVASGPGDGVVALNANGSFTYRTVERTDIKLTRAVNVVRTRPSPS
jgi:hypothetical protein